jgi:hypothetical protein
MQCRFLNSTGTSTVPVPVCIAALFGIRMGWIPKLGTGTVFNPVLRIRALYKFERIRILFLDPNLHLCKNSDSDIDNFPEKFLYPKKYIQYRFMLKKKCVVGCGQLDGGAI